MNNAEQINFNQSDNGGQELSPLAGKTKNEPQTRTDSLRQKSEELVGELHTISGAMGEILEKNNKSIAELDELKIRTEESLKRSEEVLKKIRASINRN